MMSYELEGQIMTPISVGQPVKVIIIMGDDVYCSPRDYLEPERTQNREHISTLGP